jgi:hypothetical protein
MTSPHAVATLLGVLALVITVAAPGTLFAQTHEAAEAPNHWRR